MSGLPNRETCVHGPDSWVVPLGPPWRTLAFCLLAEDHTPIVAAGSVTLVGMLLFEVTSEIGTWMAIELTLKALSVSTPAAAGVEIRWKFSNGLSVPRSNME